MQPTCLSLFPSIYKLKLPLAKVKFTIPFFFLLDPESNYCSWLQNWKSSPKIPSFRANFNLNPLWIFFAHSNQLDQYIENVEDWPFLSFEYSHYLGKLTYVHHEIQLLSQTKQAWQ